MELWAELLVRDSNSVLGDDSASEGTNKRIDANRAAIVSESHEASDEELGMMLKTVAERVTGERIAGCEDVDGLTRKMLGFQLDRRKDQDEQVPRCFGPI